MRIEIKLIRTDEADHHKCPIYFKDPTWNSCIGDGCMAWMTDHQTKGEYGWCSVYGQSPVNSGN